MPSQLDIEAIVVTAMGTFMTGFEERLSMSMQKALDMVLWDYERRIRQLEEDQARLLKHMGLE